MELSVNESKCETAGRVSYEAVMENHSRRMAHGDPRPARTPSSRGQRSSFFSGFFNEGVVKNVTYVTDFGRIGMKACIPLMGNEPPQFQFSGTGVVAALQPVNNSGRRGDQ